MRLHGRLLLFASLCFSSIAMSAGTPQSERSNKAIADVHKRLTLGLNPYVSVQSGRYVFNRGS
jgi:hypothetical protein